MFSINVGDVYEDENGKRFEVVEYHAPFIKFWDLEFDFFLLSDEVVDRVYKKV